MEKTRNSPKGPQVKSDWVKVGSCLYRYKQVGYYALIKFKGKQIRQSLETNDLPLARRKLLAFKKNLELTDPTLRGRTLGELAKTYLGTLAGSESTKANKTHFIKQALEALGTDTLVSKIKHTDCLSFLAKHEHLAASTKNQMRRALFDLLDMAVKDGVIGGNPVAGIKGEKRKTPLRLTPTKEQFESIVADLRSQKANGHGRDDTADFVELSGRLGLGQAELSAIKRKHIDLGAGTIAVYRKKTSEPFLIPLYPQALPIILRRLDAMDADPEARLVRHNDCKKGLAAACKRLGFTNFEPRSLRRFFITRGLRAGVDVPTIAKWQGHTDGGNMILGVYGAQVDLSHSQKMAALLGDTAPKPNEAKA